MNNIGTQWPFSDCRAQDATFTVMWKILEPMKTSIFDEPFERFWDREGGRDGGGYPSASFFVCLTHRFVGLVGGWVVGWFSNLLRKMWRTGHVSFAVGRVSGWSPFYQGFAGDLVFQTKLQSPLAVNSAHLWCCGPARRKPLNSKPGSHPGFRFLPHAFCSNPPLNGGEGRVISN